MMDFFFSSYRLRMSLMLAVFLISAVVKTNAVAAPDRDGEKAESHQTPRECVILLHGLARTARSMAKMAEALEQEGYYVLNVDYPSREHPIEELAASVIPAAIRDCEPDAEKIHFVAHSLGAILVRYYLAGYTPPSLGRVVMLTPPNQGSEAVDMLKSMPGFYWLNGPAGGQLGTDEDSIPLQLPQVDYEVGVITGDKTINFILSWIIPGTDDGKVSIKRAQVAGMADFLITHHTHPYIMKADDVIEQTLSFLRQGRFDRSGERPATKP
jgi:pimeloyl-ACP methyl ester carboxylesterase